MTRIRSMGLNFEKCVDDLVLPAFSRSFSIAGHRGAKVRRRPTRAESVAPWAQRMRDGAVDQVKYHPIVNEIKDEEELRAFPRCSVDLLRHEFLGLNRFKSTPEYRPFFESRRKVKAEDIKLALQGRDAYEACDYLSRTNFKDVSLTFRKSIYEDAWARSANKKTPTDLEQVLRAIPPWIEIGVKPANLFSEAFRLLPGGNPLSREAVVLCAYYRGLGRGIALPQDDLIFPILENHLLVVGSSLTMPELEVICAGFSQSRTVFSQEKHARLNKAVEKSFVKLLPTYRWNANTHCVLKHLSNNQRCDRSDNDLSEMRALRPALEDSGFFEYCLKRSRDGVRDLGVLTQFLASRNFKDDPLLGKCIDTLKIVIDEGNSLSAKIEDVAHALNQCANVGVKLDDDVVEFALSHFRGGDDKSFNGKDLLLLLDALAMNAIFPHDLIDALFSSDKFMRVVEGGGMPGMNKSFMKDPSIKLYRLDTLVELTCPDYAGARLPAEVRKLALDHLQIRVPSEEEIHKSRKEFYRFADALNEVFNELRRTKNKNFVSIARPEPSTLMDFIIIELDENNEPISSEKSPSNIGKSGSRKIAVYLLLPKHFLTHYDGVHVTEMAEILPIYRRTFAMIERRGYEVKTISITDPLINDVLSAKRNVKGIYVV